jgi:hypothetical protein
MEYLLFFGAAIAGVLCALHDVKRDNERYMEEVRVKERAKAEHLRSIAEKD